MPQAAIQPNVEQDFQSLTQAGQDVVQQFERALSGSNVLAHSNLNWPAMTRKAITGLFNLQHRSCEQLGQLWRRSLTSPGEEPKPAAATARCGNRKYRPLEPAPGHSGKIRNA